MSALLPGYEQVHGNTPRNTPYRLTNCPWKIVLHTIEGRTKTLDGFRSVAADHRNGPHLWVDALDGRRWKLQTVPLDMAARSLARPSGAPETNHARAVQVEIAGWASLTQDIPRADLEWLGAEVVAPMVRAIRSFGGNINLDYVERTYGANEGIVLATPSSPIRYSANHYINVVDWVTSHQRIPSNGHWDVGKMNLSIVLAAARKALGEVPPPPPPPPPPPQEITVAEADRIIRDLKLHVDAKVLGLMSHSLNNQKTGVIWRVEGTEAPWYGRDGDGTYVLDFDLAVGFKRLHEITENSVVITQALHDTITSSTTVVNLSGKSVDEIAAEVSTVDAEFINGLIDASVQKAVQQALITVGEANKDAIRDVIAALQQSLGD